MHVYTYFNIFFFFFSYQYLYVLLFFQPNREDEYARIEASGGKVIQWNGHRVFGVLAMSRSIGRYPSFLAQMLILFKLKQHCIVRLFSSTGLAAKDTKMQANKSKQK